MSQEAVQAFVERVNSDEAFRNDLIEAGSNDVRLQKAQDAGFDVTAEDLADLRRQAGAEELSEDDLQKIAGGLSNTEVGAISGVAVALSIGIGAALV